MELDLVAIYLRIGQVVVTNGQKIQMYFNFSLTISKNINRRDKVDKIIYLVQTMGLDSEDAYLLMEDK
jgi:hypothetical protein